MPKIHDLDIDPFLAECLRLRPENITEELTRIPGDLAYHNAKYAEAYKGAHLAKIQLDKTEARLNLEAREKLAANGKKGTEALYDSLVRSSEEYEEARVQHVEAEAERLEWYGRLDAVRAKRDMAQSIGAFMREEMRGDPAVREMVSGTRAVRDGG